MNWTLLWLMLGVGFAAGLHAAMYGAYKDSPHESFHPHRCVREIAIAMGIGAVMAYWRIGQEESPFILYLSIFALARVATEVWKLFIRQEPIEDWRIPSQMHIVSGVIQSRGVRLALGIGWLFGIYGLWGLSKWAIPDTLPIPVRGMLVGMTAGVAEAMCGGYKDGSIEGFYWHKFIKSPVFGALGGLVASGHTDSTAFLMLGAVGSMRMLLELVFKLVVPGYTPGKFRSMTGQSTEWTAARHLFIPPYALTWALYLVLATHPNW